MRPGRAPARARAPTTWPSSPSTVFYKSARAGSTAAAYLEEKIWRPIGAEADATWLVDRSGQEVTFCCLNAVLRDYARLGFLLAHEGNWRGRQPSREVTGGPSYTYNGYSWL